MDDGKKSIEILDNRYTDVVYLPLERQIKTEVWRTLADKSGQCRSANRRT